MNAESQINVHHSSLVGLKAELLRKQEEVAAAKVKQENMKPLRKPKIKEKKYLEKGKKVREKEPENKPEDLESMKALHKSKLMLQAKTRLYQQLSKSHVNMNPNFLVDFENKPDDLDHSDDSNHSKSARNSHHSDHSGDEAQNKDCDYNGDSDSDSEWVEYTDCFGRTRKCLREDLPKMQEKDEYLKKNVVRDEVKEEKPLYVEDRTPAKEPEIEIMRKKWEEQTAKISDKMNIHYQDILFDEARSHGVGYYAFSQDEEERLKQQESLFKLRTETERKQKESQKVRDIKEKVQENRLRLARIRQRIRAGLPAEETEEELIVNSESKPEDCKEQETVIDNKEKEKDPEESSKEETAQTKMEDTENKIKAFGELLGKRNRWYVMSQEEWVDKKRKERDTEFAPSYNNFEHGGSLYLSKTDRNSKKRRGKLRKSNDSSDSDKSDVIGPLPQSLNDSNASASMSLDDSDAITKPTPIPNNSSATKQSSSDEDSNIIGPMPQMSETTAPVNIEDSINDPNLSIADQIEVGLKFLRQQFERKSI